MIENFLTGIQYFLLGVSSLLHPNLRRYVLWPLAINILFFLTLFIILIAYASYLSQALVSHLPSWLFFTGLIVKLAMILLYALITLYSFFTFATIMSAPFNSFLAEKVAEMEGHLTVQKSWREILLDTPRLIGRQLYILLLYVPISILLTILLFIPVIHLVALICWVWFHAKMFSLIYLDYPTENASVSLNTLRNWINANRLLSFGFGGSVLFCSTIPVVNFLVIPAAVIGATKMWVEKGGLNKPALL